MRCRMIDKLKRVLLLWLMLCAPAAYSASKTLLVLGDSISAEYGLPRDSGWVSLLQTRLSDDKLPVSVVNASISGETTAGGLTRLPGLLQQHKPAVLIIELGGNDGLRGLSLAATQSNLREMIKSADRIGARVLLLGMRVPPNYGPDYSKRFAAMYQGLARERNVKLVPFLFAGLEDTERFFQQDRIHPNQRAQTVMLDNVWPSLQSLLK